ncbi:MAG: hypothetical protein KF830_12265 [Planctomycetes bacterium]|nr:hypothetical protein [Planctomycetota bacterium]
MNRLPPHALPTFLGLALLAVPAAAQFTLPAPALLPRVAPRAAWTAVTSGGTSSTTVHQRCDNPGAASHDRLYVFGGCKGNNTSTTLNDLWAFDAAAGTFTLVHDGLASPAPHARGRAAIAWNPITNRLVVFGGDNRATGPLPADTLLNDTWEWDPVTNTWTDVTPAAGNPTPRRWATMAHDPATGGMLLFGGDTGGGTVSGETWLFLGGVWNLMVPGTTPPARRMASLVTRNAPFGDVLLCGGEDHTLTGPYGADLYRHLDVWTWNGASWTKISDWDWIAQAGTFPASAMANQAVYDPLRQRVVLQSGQGIAANTAANTTYLYGLTTYNGSPTNFCSEFDCLTNTWTLYANPTTGTTPYNNNDPAIGRISRYYAAFVPATGKVYKVCGQNAAVGSANPAYNVYQYQANPVASATVYGTGCTGPGGALALAADTAPWTGRTLQATATGFGPLSLGFAMVSLGQLDPGVPLPLLPVPGGGPGCELRIASLDITAGLLPIGGTAQYLLPLPTAQADPTLPGLAFYLQVAELDFSAGWVGTYATNGLAFVVGSL